MAKQLIARGQTTVHTQNDAYNINQSINEYVFAAASNGIITNAASFTSTVKITLGDTNITNFTIGSIAKPAGFSAITVNNTNKTIAYSIAANTANMADNGTIPIPVIINNETYFISFAWSKAKSGSNGNSGQDAYTIALSRNNYVISTDKDGKIHTTANVATTVSAFKGSTAITPMIGTLPSVAGCSLSKSGATITIIFNIGTSLAENGIIDIPVAVDGKNFSVSFAYAKARTGANGATGAAGVDANMLDWVKDWNTNKTVIGSDSVITPKIFAGVKNSNGTLTGLALGRFALSTMNASGQVTTETIDGIYGFKDGYRTFFVDNGGNAQLGRNTQFIKYNSTTGKIEFGADVSLNWTTAANNALTSAKTYADTKKTEAIAAAATDATNKTNEVKGLVQQANDLAIQKVRYIRDWLNGSTANTGNHWVQVMALDYSGNNIALNKSVSGDSTDKRITNGNTDSNPYASAAVGLKMMIVDLGAAYDIEKVQIWHYYADGRTYNETKTEVSIDGINWFCVFDSLREGKYKETSTGRIYFVKDFDRIKNIQDAADQAKIAGANAQTIADAITQKSNDEKWATKLTYIDANGIFTGTLSANTVNAVRLNASQITAGVIDAARINVEAIKSSIITAANINALTLSVVRGTIGGWNIDSDSIFRGAKNNTSGAYTAASGAITIGSNGIRGFKWRLDSIGTGAIAGGNISWDASGNVTFGASVSVNWTTGINSITSALGGSSYPKLTKIDANGIYTGTLTATQINAVSIDAGSIKTGTLSADRIAAGSINSTKLEANSIKANIINVSYINGLTCTFDKGKIGGWNIGADTLTIGSIGTVGQMPIQIRSTSVGSGSWYNGVYKPYGLSILWYQNSNAGHIVFGQVAASGTIPKTGFIGIQMMAWDNTEYFCLSTNYTKSGAKEVYNRIAGWAFDNTRIWKNNVSLGADGAIYNGNLWKLNNDGSGQIANGNISWNAAGTVTFAASVSVSWTAGINNITSALGGSSYPKLTKIDSTGIYTGTLTASQITAGTISADRIAAGSLNASKLDAASVKASIINTDYINGLTLNFVRGKIGGWNIGSDNITIGAIGTTGAMPIQLRSVSTGLGYVYSGQYKPYGLTMSWHQSSNAGHFIFGQVMASGNAVKTGFIGIQMMSWDNQEYFCLSANYTKSGAKDFYNRIAGWAFDNDSIYSGTKNNAASAYTASAGSITIGSNGIRGFKWRLDSNGAGAVAGGNISWDASGNVTFGSSVSLNWTNAANNALTSARTYADAKKTEAINAAATDATNKANAVKELAQAMAFGRMLYRDPTFYNGNNGMNVYNNSGNGTVTITRTTDNNAPNDSKQVLVIKNTGTSSPDCGGFNWGTTTSYRKVFITRIIAKIPTGRDISYHSNSIGTGGTQKWLTPVAGTGDWCEYICKVTCGTASFSSTHFFAITGSIGTAASPIEWRIAYATVFDITSTEKYTTTIDANGIYTGSIRANQVLVDSALVVGGGSYNGSISVRDASNNIKVTLDRSGINAVGGTIGGWAIASNQISRNSVVLGSDGTISNGTKWKLGNDGSGFIANGNVSWTTVGAVTITGTINATSGTIGGFSISGNRLVNTASNSSIEFLTLSGSSSVSINASTYTLLSMRADSERTALSIQTYASGAKGISIIANAGSSYAIESYGPHQFGQRSGEKWNAPGVLFSAIVKNSSTLYNRWGNGMTVSSFSKTETGGFMCYHNLGHTDYIVVANPYWDSGSNWHGNCFIRIEFITTSSFKLRVVNADNGKQVDTCFTFAVIGRNKW